MMQVTCQLVEWTMEKTCSHKMVKYLTD